MYFALTASTPSAQEEGNGSSEPTDPGLTHAVSSGPVGAPKKRFATGVDRVDLQDHVNDGDPYPQLHEEKSILKVHTDDGEKCVPVTPETTCADVLECLRDPGEDNLCITEVKDKSERTIDLLERPYAILQQHGEQNGKVKFYLRYPPVQGAPTQTGNNEKEEKSKSSGNENDGRRQRGSSSGRDSGHDSGHMLPGGVDMTLSELQDMAARQQQQIESQQQILVAKEQRLKYLKQQEQKQQHLASENDRLRKLRDKVEAQEMKLRKLRALRGQVEQHKANNGNLNWELESIKSLFNEKEKELAMAVAKVEEMTRQLEDIRSGKVKSASNQQSPAAMAELEKLKKELMIRNKLNEQQNSKISSNRELLMKRKEEVARMDNRIHELQTRLKKKRAQEADLLDKNKNQIHRANQNNRMPNRNNPTIAAVEPIIQEPKGDSSLEEINSGQGFVKKDPKYKSLPASSKFMYSDKGNKVKEMNNNSTDFSRKRYEPDKQEEYSVPLVVTVDNSGKPIPNGLPPSPKGSPVGSNQYSGGKGYPQPHVNNTSQVPNSVPSSSAMNNIRYGTSVPARSGISHLAPRPYGSSYSSGPLPNRGTAVGMSNDLLYEEDIRQSGSGQSSPGSNESLHTGVPKVSPQISPKEQLNQPKPQNMPSIPGRPPNTSVPNSLPLKNTNTNNQNNNLQNGRMNINNNAVNSIKLNNQNNNASDSDSEQTSVSVSKGIEKFSGIIAQQNQIPHKGGRQGANTNTGGFSNLNHASALGAVRPTYRYAPKSVIANTYLGKLDNEALEKYQQNVLSLHRDFNLNAKQVDSGSPLEEIKPKLSPDVSPKEPLSDQSSPLSTISTPSPVSPTRAPQYQPFEFPSTPPHADIASDKVSYKPNTPKNIRRRHSDSDNEEVGKALHKYNINTGNKPKPLPVAQENQLLTLENNNGAIEIQATSFSDRIPETVLLDSKGNIVEVNDTIKDIPNEKDESSESEHSSTTTTVTVESKSDGPKKKSNLKSRNGKKNGNRVSFDPLALLLDASLEGELELVKRCATQVENVSESNDEGITALHNSICAGHYDIVTFLVEFGCDVNSPDSDGWTPLHCAASCNNLPMVKFLVEHGACIFATTISDHETAAEKCEEDEDGYDGCSEYLYSIQEKLGIMNNGAVYAVFDFKAENSDELDMTIGDLFTVLKKGDEQEKEWWWVKQGTKEGYIPRNLLGLTPRVHTSSQSPEV